MALIPLRDILAARLRRALPSPTAPTTAGLGFAGVPADIDLPLGSRARAEAIRSGTEALMPQLRPPLFPLPGATRYEPPTMTDVVGAHRQVEPDFLQFELVRRAGEREGFDAWPVAMPLELLTRRDRAILPAGGTGPGPVASRFAAAPPAWFRRLPPVPPGEATSGALRGATAQVRQEDLDRERERRERELLERLRQFTPPSPPRWEHHPNWAGFLPDGSFYIGPARILHDGVRVLDVQPEL